MMTDKKALARLARDVMDTGLRELSEDEALMQMVQSAEAELTEAESRRQFPDLWQYFRFHPDAREQYDILLEALTLSPGTAAPRPRAIPPRPDSLSLWDRLKEVISHIFPATAAPAFAPVRGDDERTTVLQLDATYRLTVTLAGSEDDPRQRRLSLAVDTDDPTARRTLPGSPVWLQVGADGPTIVELGLDDAGGLELREGIDPGRYTLRLQLGGQHYAVTDMDVA